MALKLRLLNYAGLPTLECSTADGRDCTNKSEIERCQAFANSCARNQLLMRPPNRVAAHEIWSNRQNVVVGEIAICL
jgi:hypothetical protein